MITLKYKEKEHAIKQSTEFTVNDMIRMHQTEQKYPIEDKETKKDTVTVSRVKRLAEQSDIPYEELKRFPDHQFREIEYIIRKEWLDADTMTEEALNYSTSEIEIDKIYTMPKGMANLPIGVIADLDEHAKDRTVWEYIPFMIAILGKAEGWDYESNISADPEGVRDSFGEANALHALAIHFFFLATEESYKKNMPESLSEMIIEMEDTTNKGEQS